MFRKHGPMDIFKVVILLIDLVYVQATIQCARTLDEWNKASATLQCQEPNYYHCLKDENGILTQQCLQRVWIQNGMCPEYNSKVGKIDVFRCQSEQKNCPNTIFWSNAVYLYPECFDYFKPTTQTYTSDKVTPPSNESTTPSLTVTDKEMTTTLAIALPLVCVAVLFGIVVFLIYRRRRKNGESSTDRGQANSVPHDHETKLSLLEEKNEPDKTMDHNCTIHGKKNSKSTDIAKELDDLASEVENMRRGAYILILLYPTTVSVYDLTIKEKAWEKLETSVNLQNDYKKWMNNKTKSNYVFKDWIKSNEDFNSYDIRATLVGILQAIKNDGKKFVFVIPFTVWIKNENLNRIGKWNLCRQYTMQRESF